MITFLSIILIFSLLVNAWSLITRILLESKIKYYEAEIKAIINDEPNEIAEPTFIGSTL